MRARLLNEADLSVGIPERDEVLAEQSHAHRIAVGIGDLLGEQGRQPVAAEDLAHRRGALDPGEQLVILVREHSGLLGCAV